MNHSFMEGGDLPANIPALAAVIGMSRKDVEEALPYWIEQKKLVVEDSCLFNRRVREEVVSELAYRRKQRKSGRNGGKARVALRKVKGSLRNNSSPPAPAPAPSPAPAPTPQSLGAAIQIPACEESPLNKAILGACREIASLVGKDETEVLKAHSMIPNSRGGGPRWIVRLDAASEDWRIRTHQDLQAELSRLKAPPEDEGVKEGLLTAAEFERRRQA